MSKEGEKYLHKYRILSSRLPGYDYSRVGLYFVTICTKDRTEYFGKIVNGVMNLSAIGNIAKKCWADIPNHFPHVALDKFVIMPDHMHGILCFYENPTNNTTTQNVVVETQNFASLHPTPTSSQPYNNKFGPQSKNLSSVIRGFKIGVKKLAVINNFEFAWQSRFHDHIIRNARSLEAIRKYILENPIKWVEGGKND